MRKLFRSILKRFKGVSKYNRYDSVNPALMTKRDLSSMCGELYVAKQWGKDYCKVQMFKHQWDFSLYTDNYEDTFHFEYKQDADAFRNKFKKYADM